MTTIESSLMEEFLVHATELKNNIPPFNSELDRDYITTKIFNAYLDENIQYVTKEFLIENCKFIWDMDKFVRYNPQLALDMDFIKSVLPSL